VQCSEAHRASDVWGGVCACLCVCVCVCGCLECRRCSPDAVGPRRIGGRHGACARARASACALWCMCGPRGAGRGAWGGETASMFEKMLQTYVWLSAVLALALALALRLCGGWPVDGRGSARLVCVRGASLRRLFCLSVPRSLRTTDTSRRAAPRLNSRRQSRACVARRSAVHLVRLAMCRATSRFFSPHQARNRVLLVYLLSVSSENRAKCATPLWSPLIARIGTFRLAN
jgi:hypothetical protein